MDHIITTLLALLRAVLEKLLQRSSPSRHLSRGGGFFILRGYRELRLNVLDSPRDAQSCSLLML